MVKKKKNVKHRRCGYKVDQVGRTLVDLKSTIVIDPNNEYRFFGVPGRSSYFNPFELGESSSESRNISLKDVIDGHGELKPFEQLNEMGCTLDEYNIAREMVRICKENGFSIKDLI